MRSKTIKFPLAFIIFSSMSVSAAEWSAFYSKRLDASIARTFDQSDESAFGVTCSMKTQNCLVVFSAGTPCEDDITIPMLINADAGSFHATGTCMNTDNTKGQIILDNFDAFVKAISSEKGELGIAYPLESGKFKANRFSLSGGSKALKEVLEMASDSPSKGKRAKNEF